MNAGWLWSGNDPFYHSPRDTPANVVYETVRDCVLLCDAFVRGILHHLVGRHRHDVAHALGQVGVGQTVAVDLAILAELAALIDGLAIQVVLGDPEVPADFGEMTDRYEFAVEAKANWKVDWSVRE